MSHFPYFMEEETEASVQFPNGSSTTRNQWKPRKRLLFDYENNETSLLPDCLEQLPSTDRQERIKKWIDEIQIRPCPSPRCILDDPSRDAEIPVARPEVTVERRNAMPISYDLENQPKRENSFCQQLSATRKENDSFLIFDDLSEIVIWQDDSTSPVLNEKRLRKTKQRVETKTNGHVKIDGDFGMDCNMNSVKRKRTVSPESYRIEHSWTQNEGPDFGNIVAHESDEDETQCDIIEDINTQDWDSKNKTVEGHSPGPKSVSKCEGSKGEKGSLYKRENWSKQDGWKAFAKEETNIRNLKSKTMPKWPIDWKIDLITPSCSQSTNKDFFQSDSSNGIWKVSNDGHILEESSETFISTMTKAKSTTKFDVSIEKTPPKSCSNGEIMALIDSGKKSKKAKKGSVREKLLNLRKSRTSNLRVWRHRLEKSEENSEMHVTFQILGSSVVNHRQFLNVKLIADPWNIWRENGTNAILVIAVEIVGLVKFQSTNDGVKLYPPFDFIEGCNLIYVENLVTTTISPTRTTTSNELEATREPLRVLSNCECTSNGRLTEDCSKKTGSNIYEHLLQD